MNNGKGSVSMRPLGTRVAIIVDDTEEIRESGIIIPDVAQRAPLQGTIIAVGEEVEHVKVGDPVLFTRYTGTEVTVSKEVFAIMKEEELLCVLEYEDSAKADV